MKSACDASAARDGGAPRRYDQGEDGCDVPDEDAAEGRQPGMALSVPAYNFTRALNIVGIKPLMTPIGTEAP
jgi:hypothetical protein